MRNIRLDYKAYPGSQFATCQFDGRTPGSACAAHRRLVNHRPVWPLWRGHVILLCAGICATSSRCCASISFSPVRCRHHVRRVARTLRNQHVHPRRRCSRAGLRILNHDCIHRRRHGYARDFSYLQSRSKQFNSRSPQRIAFQQRDLQLPLPQAQHHVRLPATLSSASRTSASAAPPALMGWSL